MPPNREKHHKEWLAKAKEIHGDKYDYSKVEYVNGHTEVTIICPIHGEFQQKPKHHLKTGCRICSGRGPVKYTPEMWLTKAKEIHGDNFDYSKVEYVNQTTKVDIKCNTCGHEFQLKPADHTNMGRGRYRGCPKCNGGGKDTEEDFLRKAKLVHGDKYDYSKVEYVSSHTPVIIICEEHGEFEQRPYAHIQGAGCPDCAKGKKYSETEINIAEYIKSFGVGVERTNRSILPGNKEIDIFVESKDFGIEFNGIHWHSDQMKHKKYHQEKKLMALDKGINLFHIYSCQYYTKTDIIKSMIKNKLGVNKKIYARNCEIRKVSNSVSNDFLLLNHLQGKCVSKIRYGLYHNDMLVALMTFGKTRFDKEHEWELIRFCNLRDHSVIGGASKLFKYFLKKNDCSSIMSYANLDYSDGNLYRHLGFNQVRITEPNYFYGKKNDIVTRYMVQKDGIKKVCKKYDPDLSEFENMISNGYERVYDSGNLVFSMHL